MRKVRQTQEPRARAAGYNPWVALVVLCVGIFTILLDTTIVNIAVPSILSGLHASLDQVLWVLNAYILVYAVLLIPAGRLGDIFGPRRMFIAGVAISPPPQSSAGSPEKS